MILNYASKLRNQVEPQKLNFWLGCLEGWAEIDSLCQSNFSAKEVLGNWQEWQRS